MNDVNTNPADNPLQRIRSTVFELVRTRRVTDLAALHLLRTAELVLPEAQRDNVRTLAADVDGLQIVDESRDGTTWRAYPDPATTIEELNRACERFNLRPWVDVDGKVCLITLDGPGSQRPSAGELAAALYGVDGQVPAFLRKQAE